MTERLRSRDSRSNVNKCYTIYFEDDTFGIGKQRKRDTTSLARDRNLKTKSTSKNQVTSKERLVNNHHTSKRVVGSKIKKPMISSKPKKKTSSQYELKRTTSSEAPQELAPTQPEQKSETETFQEERDKNKNTATNVSESTDISESDNVTSQNDMEKHTLTPFVGDDGANGKKSILSCASERDCSREEHVQIEKSESFESEVESNKRKFPTPTLLLSLSSSSTTSLSCEKEMVESCPESRTKKFRKTEEKDQMFEVFQPWAVKTYGDESKAKTITRKKKSSILQILDGDGGNPPPCPKLRCWVQSKGFTTKHPQNEQDTPLRSVAKLPPDDGPDLYVGLAEKDFFGKGYRKVAIVEEFFDIIYDAHVELGSRDGKHAGQKRTYKIITDSYIYLPRRAVTKFLTLCATCRNNPLDTSHAPVDESTLESSLDVDTSCNFHEVEDNVSTSDLKATSQDGVDAPEKKCIPLENAGPKENRINETAVEQASKEDANKESGVESKVLPDMPMEEIKGELERRVHQLVADDENEVSSTQDDTKPEQSLADTSTDKSEENLSHPEVSSSLTPSTPLGSSAQDVTVVEEKFSEFAVPQCKKIKLKSTATLISDKKNDPPEFPKINSTKVSSKATPPKKRYNNFQSSTTIDYVPLKPSTQNLQKAAMTFSAYTAGLMACDDAKSKLLKSYLDGFNTHKLEVCKSTPLRLDLRKVNPITSTYLKMTRSMGLSDEDALKFDGMETVPTSTPDVSADPNPEDAYAGLMKDADKLKLMLLAWNYQNSNAVRNGTEGPDLGVVGGLWAQYQNALALTAKQSSVSPINRADQSSPIENQDETNSSGQKDEDDASEDDSDDKLDQNAQDPERLKAFNMFVRLFVDENLDRMIPISKQPKEKIQAIIDSCARQFPEFCERSRKRIRTYLKSCRRNKKAKEGWDNSSRPTPAHLTSVQAEQILALACENESLNAKRMRIGLDPISQSLPLPSSNNAPTETMAPSITYPGFRATPTTTSGGSDTELAVPSTTSQTVAPARTSPLGLSVSTSDTKSSTSLVNGTTSTQVSSPIYRPADFASPSSTSSPFQTRPQPYSTFFQNTLPTNAPTDLSMKQQQQQQQQQLLQPPTNPQLPITGTATNPPSTRPPLISHKLNPNEINAVRQLITGYRESAAFLLRSADELEQLLLQQQ